MADPGEVDFEETGFGTCPAIRIDLPDRSGRPAELGKALLPARNRRVVTGSPGGGTGPDESLSHTPVGNRWRADWGENANAKKEESAAEIPAIPPGVDPEGRLCHPCDPFQFLLFGRPGGPPLRLRALPESL